MNDMQQSVILYGLGYVCYLPVIFYGASQNLAFLDIYGTYLILPIGAAIFSYYLALAKVQLNVSSYVILHSSLLASFILGIPFVAWRPMGTLSAQTGAFAGLATLILSFNLICYSMIIYSKAYTK